MEMVASLVLYNDGCKTLLSPEMCPNTWLYVDDNYEWAIDTELQIKCGMF